jgi:hypothetical protein
MLLDFNTMDVGPNFDPICLIENVMHPNAKGAERYFEALSAELPQFFPVWRG